MRTDGSPDVGSDLVNGVDVDKVERERT
jgi:hypothetical protein